MALCQRNTKKGTREMNNEPVSHQYVSVLERIVVRQVAEIEHLKELFGCDPAYYEKSAKTLTDRIAELEKQISELKYEKSSGVYDLTKTLTDDVKDALMDALSGWKYIRHSHGDLYGVGWDRVQDKLEAILRKAQENG